MSTDRQRAHLGLLRALSQRMWAGSLLLKGWLVVLVGALLALASSPLYARWAWAAVVLTIAFWLLDAHLQRQRGLYRKVHARARLQRDAASDFSLDTSAVDSEADAWTSLMFSRTLVAFYGGVLGAIAALRLWTQ